MSFVIGFGWNMTAILTSSSYVDALMENYDPDEWAATVIVSVGEPKDPRSKKVVGLAFKTEEYAKHFFETLHHWNGSSDHRQQDLCITFIIDEDRYYVYLYSNPEKARIKSFKNQVEQENLLSKYGETDAQGTRVSPARYRSLPFLPVKHAPDLL